MAKRPGVRFGDVHRFVEGLVGEDLHAKRVYSLANATLGVISSASLAVHAIGQGLALARGLRTKHAVKQVDRLLSNRGIDPWALAEYWVPYVLAERSAAVVALDWTDFDADGQMSIVASLVTGQGRAIPLVWRTVEKATLKDERNGHEDAVHPWIGCRRLEHRRVLGCPVAIHAPLVIAAHRDRADLLALGSRQRQAGRGQHPDIGIEPDLVAGMS